VLEGLKDEATIKNAKLITVNFDKDADFLKTYNVPDRSQILVFRNGKETSRIVWKTGVEDIRSGLLAGLQ
jgi:hypothetical protein